MQEKRKIPVFPNGSAPSSGEIPKEADHHAGPELQRTGRWVQLPIHYGCLWSLGAQVIQKAQIFFYFTMYLNLILYSFKFQNMSCYRGYVFIEDIF